MCYLLSNMKYTKWINIQFNHCNISKEKAWHDKFKTWHDKTWQM